MIDCMFPGDGKNDDSGSCSAKCRKATCGDGIVQPFLFEECDEGKQHVPTKIPAYAMQT
jgi:hypothetical protein